MRMQKKVADFEKKMGWDKTPAGKIVAFLKTDATELGRNVKHKLVDIHFETIQLANRKSLDLEKELDTHMRAAMKKYGK